MRHGLAISNKSADARPRDGAREGVRGGCPSLHRPMTSGDGLLSRVKPTAASLSAGQLRGLAGAAAKFGNGQIELTRRCNFQIRGLTEASVKPFADAIVAEGLADADPASEAARTVMTAPLSGKEDRSCGFDCHALATQIEAAILGDRALHELPAKFGVAVCGGGLVAIANDGYVAGADITLSPAPDGAIAMRLTGGKSVSYRSSMDAVSATIRMMHVAVRHFKEDGGRVKDLVGRVGEAALFAEAGLVRSEMPPSGSIMTANPPVLAGSLDVADTHTAIVAAAPFGRTNAVQADAIAGLADDFGDGTVRITPWRSLLLAGIETNARSRALKAAAAAGFIVDPRDPRLRIAACTGAPGCSRAQSRTLDDAAILAPFLQDGASMHISGCAKGCACSDARDFTLVAQADGYDLIRKGAVDDLPTQEHLPEGRARSSARKMQHSKRSGPCPVSDETENALTGLSLAAIGLHLREDVS